MKKKRVDNLKLQSYLSEERSTFSEERTILAYITTVLTFFVSVIVLIKLFFEKHIWAFWVLIILMVLCLTIIIYFTFKLRKVKRDERYIKRKLPKISAL